MSENRIEAAKKIYEYAYPIVLSDLVSKGSKEAFWKARHLRKFIVPEDGITIVKPNNDTLYSSCWTRLKESPYILEVPDIADERYLLVDMLNMKTEVICSIGTRTNGTKGGKYIFLYRDEPVPKGYEAYEVIRSEDSRNMFLIRLESFGAEDYENANQIQDQFVFEAIYPDKITDDGTALLKSSVETIEQMEPKEYFERFVSAYKDTVIASEVSGWWDELGIHPKQFDYEALDTEIKETLMQGAERAYDEIRGYEGTERFVSNGWETYIAGLGKYGDNYLYRAYIAWTAYGANLSEDSVYPMLYKDAEGNCLDSKKEYILHFEKDGLPRAEYFWSITLYGEPSQMLAKNAIRRYLINSHGVENLYWNEDGSLDILISRRQPEDERLFYNWLPAPLEEEEFSLTMRIYGPDADTLNGKWEAPRIINKE